MRHATRPWALVLGVLLALAWSSAALAQSRNKGGRGGRTGSFAKKDDGRESRKAEKSTRETRRAQPRAEAPKPAPRPTRSPAYQPPRAQSPRSPAYQPPRTQSPRFPAYQPPRAQQSRPSVQPTRAPSYGPAPGPSRPRPEAAAGGVRRSDQRLTVRRVPAPVRRTPAVPPLVNRGGKTFQQAVTLTGGRVVVTRKAAAPPAATNSPYSHGGSAGASAHHDGHHDTTTVRHYHYHYWGWGWYYCYVPYWTYDPWFWGWYWGPFAAPWHHSWWWAKAPWYRSWGWYYSPYAVYVAPSYWVTDYTLARMLEDEYARGFEDGQAAAGTPISEPVKERIRTQVDDVARTFQESEALLLERALADPEYLFIVDTSLSVATGEGGVCALGGGDIIRRAPGDEDGRPVASMTVVTSKSDKCPAGSQVSVSYSDLQEMLNTFGQTVDDGLNELQRQQGERTAE